MNTNYLISKLMSTKIIRFFYPLLFFLLSGCAKEIPGPSGGLKDTYWEPIHAKGELIGKEFTIKWDNDVDSEGGLSTTYYIGGDEVEYSMTFSGYHFYYENGRNVFSTFAVSAPNLESSPRMYYVSDGALYLETVFGSADYYSSSQKELEPTGKFEKFALEEHVSNRMAFAGVTYRKVQK